MEGKEGKERKLRRKKGRKGKKQDVPPILEPAAREAAVLEAAVEPGFPRDK